MNVISLINSKVHPITFWNNKKYLNKLKNCTVKPLEFQQCLSIFFLFNFDSKTEKKKEKKSTLH